jgi:DNA-binding MarR family transcriptional regulator
MKRVNQTTRKSAIAVNSGEQQQTIGYSLIELYDIYVRFLTNQTHSKLMNLNLTQWRTLTMIRVNPGQTQRAVAAEVGIDPSSMTPIIDVFETKGWVQRHKSPSNRSAYGLHMTPSGLKAYEIVQHEIAHAEELFVELLGGQNHKRLVTTLHKMHGLLKCKLTPAE